MDKQDWSIPDEKGIMHIPDALDPLWNKIGMQFRFVQYSGKSEVIAVAHIIQLAQDFFSKHPHLLNNIPTAPVCDATKDDSTTGGK
ncbi:MAG: hypothetical protein V4615_05180 [Bacteroidota bacterium]